jgi:hypothetical protein
VIARYSFPLGVADETVLVCGVRADDPRWRGLLDRDSSIEALMRRAWEITAEDRRLTRKRTAGL